MFCRKCGAKIEDGSKFCPSCGASLARVAVPKEEVKPEVTAEPQQPQQNYQQPQQTWQQPQQNYQQPQQTWQRPQQNYQQPQQTWQQPQQYYQQPQQNWQPQPGYGQAAGYAAAATAKKGGKGLIIALIAIAAVAAIVVGAVFIWPSMQGSVLNATATPEEYYRYVDTAAVDDLAGAISSTYENVIGGSFVVEDESVSGNLSIELGEKGRSLILDAIGEELDEINPGDDLKWFKKLAATYELNRKGDKSGLTAKLRLNDKDIVNLNAVADIEAGKIYVSIPELSDKYLALDLEELDLDDLDFDLGNLEDVLDVIMGVGSSEANGVLKALPDEATLNNLIKKYLDAAVECMDDVEKEEGELSVAGVSEDYTVVTITLDAEGMRAVMEKILPMLKEDRDVKKLIIDVSNALDEDGEEAYEDFISEIDDRLADLDSLEEDFEGEDLVMKVYTDNSGKVHGRAIISGDKVIEILMPESGGKFGLRVRYTDDDEEMFRIEGSGKRTGDKLTGTLDVEIKGENIGKVGLDGFDDERLKKGELVGAITFKPSSELIDTISEDIPSTVKSIIDDVEIRLDMNIVSDKCELKLKATSGGDLVTISLDGRSGGSKNISAVSGIDPEEWAEDITLDKLEKVIDSLEKAGVPQAYADELDEALEDLF